jgi:hypothetical protein
MQCIVKQLNKSAHKEIEHLTIKFNFHYCAYLPIQRLAFPICRKYGEDQLNQICSIRSMQNRYEVWITWTQYIYNIYTLFFMKMHLRSNA